VKVKLADEVKAANRFVMLLADNDAGLYGLLVIPVSLALSVVQVRERTSLVRSLTGTSRRWLVGLAPALWVTVVVRLLVQSPGGPGLMGVL
jgi:hypothetical protein